jgi:hypothetical protein
MNIIGRWEKYQLRENYLKVLKYFKKENDELVEKFIKYI